MYGGVVIVIQLYGLFQYSINDRQFWKTHEETQASLGELPSVLRRFDRGTLVTSQVFAVKQILIFSEIVQVCPQGLARNWLPKPLKTLWFSRCFSLRSPQGPSPKSLVGEKTPPHTGVDWAQGGPETSQFGGFFGMFFTHHRVFDGKRKHMSDICPPDVPRFFVNKNPLNLTIGAILPAEIHRCPKVPGHFQPFQPRTATATSPTESSCPSPSTCSRRWPRPGL